MSNTLATLDPVLTQAKTGEGLIQKSTVPRQARANAKADDAVGGEEELWEETDKHVSMNPHARHHVGSPSTIACYSRTSKAIHINKTGQYKNHKENKHKTFVNHTPKI